MGCGVSRVSEGSRVCGNIALWEAWGDGDGGELALGVLASIHLTRVAFGLFTILTFCVSIIL